MIMEVFFPILGWQLHPQFRVMSWGKGFFALFPEVRMSPGRWVRGCTGTRADDDRTYFWNRQERTSHWEMPPGIRPGWVRSRDGLFVHIDTQNVLSSTAGMH